MIYALLWQVESRCEPQKLVSKPLRGQLPLPASLDKSLLEYVPSKVEDFNAIAPSGARPLATPPRHPKVTCL